MLVSAVLRSLGRGAFEADNHYERLKTFYRGNGWFSDGPGDAYDYYNAWGIHYTLYWIDRVTPGYDGAFLNSALNDFADNFKCLFSPVGYPITGRSICYRVGAPAPLVMAATGPAGRIGPGMARRVLDCTWCHFVERGAVRYGALTQGYWHQDLRFLDNDSGPASPLWSLHSLVPAFLAPPEAPFWRAPEEALPVERVSYAISLPEIRWEIHGDHETGEVSLIKLDNQGFGWRKPDKVALKDRLSGFIPGGTRRPENNYLKCELYEYSALKPFCIVVAHAEYHSGSS